MPEHAGLYPEGALILAPLSGYTDIPYRRIARRYGFCRYAFTEMVEVSSLAYDCAQSFAMLERDPEELFLGAQLVGSDPGNAKRAMEKLKPYRFDVLDLNLGCPVPKVCKKGAGAALGRNYDQAMRMFEILVRGASCPVSAKLRIIDESEVEPTLRLARGLAELGAVALTVHGRVREKVYSGPVHADQIAAVRETVPASCQVIANGGVMSRRDAERLRASSGCTRLMLARGAMGNPWLFREIAEGAAYTAPSMAELCRVIFEHLTETVARYGEDSAMRSGRKLVIDYLRGRGFHGEFRGEASHLTSLEELRAMLARASSEHSGKYWPPGEGERALAP